MTRVMARRTAEAYAGVMDAPTFADLERLVDLERSVSRRLDDAGENPEAVVAAGNDVIGFAALEERLFFPILPLLDPLAQAELAREHEQLEDDLQLLGNLMTATPESPDVAALASAVARRLRAHIARDGRLLAQGLRLAAAVRS
jgi:hypothetical protein